MRIDTGSWMTRPIQVFMKLHCLGSEKLLKILRALVKVLNVRGAWFWMIHGSTINTVSRVNLTVFLTHRGMASGIWFEVQQHWNPYRWEHRLRRVCGCARRRRPLGILQVCTPSGYSCSPLLVWLAALLEAQCHFPCLKQPL